MTSKFDEFVRKQSVQGPEDEKVNLAKEKADWIQKLEQLYTIVADSLDKYLADGSIKIQFSALVLHEELLGDYTVREARITVGKQVVRLKPIGTFLIGARGRVDMTGPRGVARFMVVPPDSRGPRIRVTVSVVGSAPQPPSAETPLVPPAAWVWKIASGPPNITYIDLTTESFREVLMGVVGG